MGFFDRFSAKKPESAPGRAEPVAPAAAPATAAAHAAGVPARLLAAREKLEAKDLPGALAIYDDLLATAGDRADVLVAISGDLGTHGHIAEIIELIAPRYDAERHGPATGLNILQAYLATRNPDAAQHVLDILFALERPELEERLHGFSNAIAELIHDRHSPLDPGAVGAVPEAPKIGLITLSKPVWFYGLDPLASQILPAKDSRLRRIAFAQLALPGAYPDLAAALKLPEDELGRLSRALPAWLAETFYFSPHYAPIAAVGVLTAPGRSPQPMLFAAEWTADNLRQLVDSATDGLDYIIAGSLRHLAGDYEIVLRVWEVKKFRERKTFTARWTPATVDAELTKLHEQVRGFMEWSAEKAGLPYTPPAQPRAWLDTLGASLATFMLEKNLHSRELMPPLEPALAHAAKHAADDARAALAFLTLRDRAKKLGLGEAPANVALADSPVVAAAANVLS